MIPITQLPPSIIYESTANWLITAKMETHHWKIKKD